MSFLQSQISEKKLKSEPLFKKIKTKNISNQPRNHLKSYIILFDVASLLKKFLLFFDIKFSPNFLFFPPPVSFPSSFIFSLDWYLIFEQNSGYLAYQRIMRWNCLTAKILYVKVFNSENSCREFSYSQNVCGTYSKNQSIIFQRYFHVILVNITDKVRCLCCFPFA